MEKLKLKLALVIVLAMLCSGLLAMGEPAKRQQQSSHQELKNGKAVLVQQPEFENSAEKQFSRAYESYLQAKSVNYGTYLQEAITDFTLYLKHYPEHGKRLDAIFFLEKLYMQSGSGAVNQQETYLNQYFAEAPTGNFYYKFAQLDQANLLIQKNELVKADNILQELLQKYPNDQYMKQTVYQSLVSVYEGNSDKVSELLNVYKYLLEKTDYKNKDTYYIHCYGYAKLNYDLKNYSVAKKYFTIVKEARDFHSNYMPKFAGDYLNKIAELTAKRQ